MTFFFGGLALLFPLISGSVVAFLRPFARDGAAPTEVEVVGVAPADNDEGVVRVLAVAERVVTILIEQNQAPLTVGKKVVGNTGKE